MRSIAVGLDLEESFFDDKIQEQYHNLRLLSYPSIKADILQKDGQSRAGAHTGQCYRCRLFARLMGLQTTVH